MEGRIENATNQSVNLIVNHIDQGEEGASLHNKGYVATTEHQSITIMTSLKYMKQMATRSLFME